MEAREGIPILPILVIFPFPMPPKATSSLSSGFRSRNIDLSPIMCREQLLLRYQLKPWPFPTKDICNRNNMKFWYPNHFGSNNTSTLRQLFLLIEASKLGIFRLTTKSITCLDQNVTWRKIPIFLSPSKTYNGDVGGTLKAY